MKYAALVYQAGIANVFEVDAPNYMDKGRNARRLMQSDFRSCELFALGLQSAGVTVYSAVCNLAGDIARQGWGRNLEDAPFSDKFHPVGARTWFDDQIHDGALA